jgi:hypothetical protein
MSFESMSDLSDWKSDKDNQAYFFGEARNFNEWYAFVESGNVHTI